MKLHNFQFSHFLLSLFSAMLLVSCTLMDNDLRDLHDIPGYDNVVHIEDENMTCDYQYQDSTIVMDERYEPYIQSIDYENHKLYMYDYTPEEMMPVIGQPLISPQNAKLEWGIMHTPTKITREGNLYVLDLERTTIDDVFKVFRLDGEWDLMKESEYDVDLSDTTYTEISDNYWTRAGNNFKNYDGDWEEVDVLPLLSLIAGGLAAPKIDGAQAGAIAALGGKFNFSWPRNIQRDDKGRLKKSSDGFAINVSAKGALRIRWKTLCKVKTYLNEDGHKVELVADAGSELQIIPQISGKLEVTADFWDILKLRNPTFGPLSPIPVWITIEPAIDASISIEGTLGYKWSKTFRTEFAAYNNIHGKEDGVSIKNKNTPIKKEPLNDIKKWEQEGFGSLDLALEAGAGGVVKVLFGAPTDYPNVGLSAGIHVGARFKTVIDYKNNNYDNCIRFGIPLKLNGTLFLNVWDGFTIDWSFADAIAKLAGKEEGAEWEFASTDFRAFPSIDYMSVTCTNKEEIFTTPNYKISFNVLDQGMKMWNNIRPVLNIYLHDDESNSVIMRIDDKSPTNNPKRYEWTLYDPRIIRGVYYDAEVCWVEKRDEYNYSSPDVLDAPPIPTGKTYDKLLCSKRFTFSSESPTVVIDDVTTTSQKRYKSDKKVKKEGSDWVHDIYFDYIFRTHQRFSGRGSIAKWGFTINGKNFPINEPPQSDMVSVVWKIQKQKIKRELTIIPYIVPGNMDTWVYGPSKKVTLEYDEELNDYNNIWEKIGERDYYTSGYNWEEQFKQPTDYVMDKAVKSRKINNTSGDNDDQSGSSKSNKESQVIVIEIDE